MVFVAPNIFANEQNRSKRRRCSTNFTLGPGVICIYIESIRFWFIIVAVLGVGAGNWGRLAGILSPVMRPLSMNIPGRGKAGDNYGAGTKAAALAAFTQCFKSGEREKVKQWRPQGASLFRSTERFSGGQIKKIREKEKSQKMKLIYQHSTDPVVITVWAWH